MEALKCLRCDADMEYSGREQFQLGEESFFGGIRGAIEAMSAGSVCMDIYKCPDCGKIEFFQPRARETVRQPKTNWTCSQCGFYNFGRVHACQSCGVTRARSEDQKRKE